MADSFLGMMFDRIQGAQRARLMRQYAEQGYSPAQAAALADSLAAIDTSRIAPQLREFYRANPRHLADGQTASDAELPGYDPTRRSETGQGPLWFDPVYNALMDQAGEPVARFSRPMTEEDRIIARQTFPIPQGSVEDRPSQQPNIIDRAMSVVSGGGGSPGMPPQATAPSVQGPAIRDAAQAAPANLRAMDSTLFGEDTGQAPAPMRAVDSTLFGEDAGPRPAPLNSLPTFAQGATSGRYDPAVVNLARSVVAPRSSAPTGNVPTPTPRPKDEGFFSSLFANKPMSRDELLTAYNKSMQDEGGGNAALFALLERANKEEGMRRGGVAQQPQATKGGGKDAALHKALEIIHHMLTTRH